MTSLATVAHSHLGEAGHTDTCLKAVNRWVEEAGGHALPTESVSQAVQLVKAGLPGWTYHEGLDGAKAGDVLRWARTALRPTSTDPNPEHVSVWTATDHDGNIQSVGSGGPTGKVALQPQGGGYNARSCFRGYFRVSTSTPAAHPAAQPKPAKSTDDPIVVAKGDDLLKIAAREHTTVKALLKANPKAADGKTRDYHITRPNLILVGQRLHRR